MLSFLGPKTVVVDQPIVLTGIYDPQKIQTVSVVAEDKFPLAVNLNANTKVWYVGLDKGFNLVGKRWFRLQGKNAQNQAVSNQVFEVTVEREGINIGSPFRLIPLQDTLFKKSPVDSAKLTATEKYKINAGEFLGVDRYKVVGNHLQVDLNKPLPNVGEVGYVFLDHVTIAKGSEILWFEQADLPPTPTGTLLLWITTDTLFKLKPSSSALLAPNQFVNVPQGRIFTILGYACVENHFRVSSTQRVPGIGNSGFLYRHHVRIFQQNQEIPYNTNALNLTVVNSTFFKKRPVDSAYLSDADKISLAPGMIYGIQSYAFEEEHIKVALTENFPGFGNTGYVYPDFVQVTQAGVPIMPDAEVITYNGPTEVLVNQPTTLRGTFDSRKVETISLKAEDRYGLNVTLNRSTGTWEVILPKGFQEVGYRWLRLRAFNPQEKLVGTQVVNLTVSKDPLTVGESLTLTVTKDTLFKVAPLDSGGLRSDQKIAVTAGQVFAVSRYGILDSHLKVLLNNGIPPVGNFGYFFPGHISLKKGKEELKFSLEEVPNTEANAQLLVIKTTAIKPQPVDTASLNSNQYASLLLGQTLAIRGYASTDGHFRVTLAESIPGFGNVGYIYWQHVQLVRAGKEILFNPNALTMTIQATTVLKKQPVDASKLSANEKTTLSLGRVYGVNSYGVEANHLRVALTEELPNFGNTGYVFPGHVQLRAGSQTLTPIPPQLELNVPYFSQRDNPRYSWATCNVTAIAMVMAYHGVRPRFGRQLEDELLQWTLDYAGAGSYTEHNVLTALIKAYGFKTSFNTTRQWYEIKEELLNRRPVVLAGDFIIPSGHIITLTGYDSRGYIANDPWGDAYSGYTSTYGRRLLYSYGYLNQVAGPDGNVWAHFISP
ncbi:MAG: C39 family peptidase [Microcoleaceae cyanobacterium]